MDFLILTGMSGAGKSQAAKALEDIGYYCVDNIPPAIIPSLIALSSMNGELLNKVAAVTDMRGGDMFSEIDQVLNDLTNKGVEYKILFLDASDEVLIRRYKENRRKHPLLHISDNKLSSAVAYERQRLVNLKNKADFIIDTSFISVAQLKEKLSDIFLDGLSKSLNIQCMSFGFKYGVDTAADLVFDVRCLPNPYYVDELRSKTGLDKEIKDYVLGSDESKDFFKKLKDFIDFSVPLYAKEGKSQLTIAFGCTGGKHRSVTFAELIFKHLIEQGYLCSVIHRDIQKR